MQTSLSLIETHAQPRDNWKFASRFSSQLCSNFAIFQTQNASAKYVEKKPGKRSYLSFGILMSCGKCCGGGIPNEFGL